MAEMEGQRRSPSLLDCKVSKSELLRGIISDRLTAAAREIFAVVERTVSGFEEEAAGLRREIDRQRLQLEAVLQPRVSLSRTDVDSWSCTTIIHTEEEEGQGEEDEEEELPEEPPKIGRAEQRYLKDPDYQIPGTRDPSLRRRRRKRQDVIILRVCLVRDFRGDSLNQCLYKHPIQKVRCPVGLQEAEFLDLLKSTFPQLSAGFNTFTVNTSKRLVPLKLKKLTAEEIERSLRSTGRGRSALYLQVKTPTGPERRFPPNETANDEEFRTRVSSFGMRDLWEPPIRLRVCLLKDKDEAAPSQDGNPRQWSTSTATDIGWSNWFIKLPVQTMKFPPGLTEAEFLTLLRSALPQLTGDFQTFANNSRKMTPLKVNRLTPEEIRDALRATGKGRSALYIREKKTVQSSSCSEELLCPQIKEETTSYTSHDEDSPTDPADGAQSNDRGHRPGDCGQQQEAEDGGQQDMSEDFAALSSPSSDADSGDNEVTEDHTHAASADPGRGGEGGEECKPEEEETMVDSRQRRKRPMKRSRGRRRKRRRTSTEGVGPESVKV